MSGGRVRFGYKTNRTIRFLNAAVKYVFVLAMLIASTPIFLVLSIVMKILNPGPLFYSGVRLGKGKKLFNMYKFRTLPVGAQQKIGAELLGPTTMQLPRYIRVIRDTRVDELPQLWNVLCGSMNFIGPRPERPEIYESMCKSTEVS